MSALDLIVLVVLFLLVGGVQQVAERCRELLDFLRPPQPEPPPAPPPRPFHVPPPSNIPEEVMVNGAAMPPPPVDEFRVQLDREYQEYLSRQNPDHEVKKTDKDLGGVESHIPPSLTGEEPEDQ